MDGLGPLVGQRVETMGLSYIKTPPFGENSTSSSVNVLQGKKIPVYEL